MKRILNEDHPPSFYDASPDDILAIIKDGHRQQCQYDPEANPDIVLSRESTVQAWREACDLVGWKALAEAMNAGWRVEIPLQRWREILEPANAHTLGAVCDLLAQHAKLPRIRPAKLLGAECLPAGAFLIVRSYLAAAGVDAKQIAPSTALAEYTRRYPGVFIGPVSHLAPGALPAVKIRTPVYDAFGLGFLLSWIGLLISFPVGLFSESVVPVFIAVVLVLTMYLGVLVAARHVLPANVELPGLRTFRDLSLALATGARR